MLSLSHANPYIDINNTQQYLLPALPTPNTAYAHMPNSTYVCLTMPIPNCNHTKQYLQPTVLTAHTL